MAKHNTLTELFSAIANAIRAKGKTTAEIVADDFPEAIENLKGGTSSSEVTAGKAQVLEGYTTITNDSADEIAEGTMPNNGATGTTLNAGGSYTIPAGYTSGGTVTANSLSSQTGVQSGKTAIGAAQVLTGYEGWVNGNRVTGTMADNGATGTTLAINGTYTIPAGYTSGGTVTQSITTKAAATITPSTSSQTAVAAGTYCSGAITVGAIPSQKAAATYNTSTSDQTIAASQWLSGAQTIKAVTTSNIDAGNIKKGVVVTVGDGNSSTRIKNVTGTYTTVSSGQSALTAGVLLSGYSGFANGGGEVKGTMTLRNYAQTGYTSTPSGQTTGTFCLFRMNGATCEVIPAYGFYNQWSWNTPIKCALSAQAAKTVTPSTSAQTAVSAGYYTTGAVTVAAIPNQKSDSGNTKLNGSTQTKSFAAGYYANAHGATVDYYSPTTSSY